MAITALTTPNGSISLLSSRQVLAGIGKYFTVTEPTFGTGVAHALLTATSATANGFLCVSNSNPTGGANIYFDRLAITETAPAPTGTLKMVFEAISETGIVAFTGNAATRTANNVNSGAANTTGATVQMFSTGAGTVPAVVGTRRSLFESNIDTGLGILHDTYVLNFGADGVDPSRPGATAVRATDNAIISVNTPPICVAPGNSAWLNMYWITAAANTPSWLYSFSFIEV